MKDRASMKFNHIKYVSVILLFIMCSPKPYQLHIDSSYFASHNKPESQNINIFSQMNQDSTIILSGIYSNSNLFLEKYPIIRGFDKSSGFFSIPLSESLNYQTDVLLKIKGKVTLIPQKFPMINKTIYHKHINVISYEIIAEIKNIIKIVNQEYLNIRQNLQGKITPQGSKLQLKNVPNWNIWYKEDEQKFVFSFHQFDLMYAADVEFVVDAVTKTITDVFAREWFKGE
jgi:hypothetical protein